jgi:ABC-type glycerol-3-phosphate transport system substrate-binding protein
MAAGDAFLNAPAGRLLIDGAAPGEAAERIIFPVFYQNPMEVFPLDRYGNDALIRPTRLQRWSKAAVREVGISAKYPWQVALAAGAHTFEFSVTEETLWLGSVYVEAFVPPPTYEQYLAANPATESAGVLIELEAEHPTYKNDTVIRPANDRGLEVTPYDTYRLLLNTLGGESWQRDGSAVYYAFEAPADGMYEITVRALQKLRLNAAVYRRITINDQVLFDELHTVPFPSTKGWTDVTLGGATPYRFYLRQGVNILGIEANTSPYSPAIERIRQVLDEINDLALEVKKLTGNQVDPFKEWVISDYIPDIRERLLAIADELRADQEALEAVNGSSGSPEILTYQMVIDNILFLADDPDKIPVHLKRLSEGTGSAAQQLASILPTLQNQPLALDKIFIHSPDSPPTPVRVPFVTRVVEGLKRFFGSFRPDPYQSIGANQGEFEVWVNRPRQYVELLQTLTDELFTTDTGIGVKFSVMPDESKLVLANAAGIQPDVALGVSTGVPYELAIRGALKDLRSFSDFDRYIRIYAPGALLSYIINDSVYALPETQDFWVTFYRQDIMESLGLPIPTTWNEVIQILPELQRFGLNYSTALSSGTGSKGYMATAPYLFNFGAQLYSPDGFSTGLGSDEAIMAMKFMAESFTLYGMPLATASFYDSFRAGNLPIGISNVETYLKLFTTAPELEGRWSLAPYPATVLPDGRQLRYATGSAQASIMFASTGQPEAAWEFLKWWMSTETQAEFQQQLVLNYGPEYLWNSANVEAFAFSPIPQAHKDIILEQWEWMQEPVKLPGSYMQEREISNAWNRIVFDGVNPRVAIDRSILIVNREITRKMEEFGYLQEGIKVREFKIPTIETVQRWMDEAD